MFSDKNRSKASNFLLKLKKYSTQDLFCYDIYLLIESIYKYIVLQKYFPVLTASHRFILHFASEILYSE